MVDPQLPSRMFPEGMARHNQKIISYSKLWWLSAIAGSLEPAELTRLKASSLGKLFDFPTKFTFSRTFVHYILRKMLRTKKKHELWFVFGGKPWCFSLREFGIVTGLNCGKIAEALPMVKGETDYWKTLFPSNKPMSVLWVLKQLQKRDAIEVPEVKIRYAALLIVDGILCSSSHQSMISREHVELIKDLDAFLSYPWGTLSFQTSVNSIKHKTRSLAGSSSMSLQGFLLPLQIVALEAILAIKETLSEGDAAESEPEATSFHLPAYGIRISKVKQVELEVEVQVISCVEGDVPHS